MSLTAILLDDCKDAKRIVAHVWNLLYSSGANILSFDQHQDNEAKRLFMRVEFDLAGFTLALTDFVREFQPIVDRFGMRWRIEETARRARVAIFGSRYQHSLLELLHRHQTGSLR